MGPSVALRHQRRPGAKYPSWEIGELAACRGSDLSSEGLARDRTFLVIVVFFNVMKGPSVARLSTGGSVAIGVTGGAHRVVCNACPLSLPGRGTQREMSADVVAVRPAEYATGDGRSVLSSKA